MSPLSRRGFLCGSAAIGASAALSLPPAQVRAGEARLLSATRRTIEVGGRAASVMGLVDVTGRPGLTLDPGEPFRIHLANDLDVETIIHWHGQVPPNAQDGVSNTNPMLAPGARRRFDFAPRPGTFWMHSHIPAQEIDLLAAPLIVRGAADLRADRQEVVLFLHDFSFKSGEEVLAEITGGAAMPHGEVQQGSHADGNRRITGLHGADTNPAPAPMAHGGQGGQGGREGGMAMDLNDYEFDAYLANDRTLDDPETVRVERGGKVLLRVINASSMTAFWIDLGGHPARLVAVDGDPVQPLAGGRFGLAQGQRLDIALTMPADGTALPVLALREGAPQRTGLVLAPAGAEVRRIAGLAEAPHPAYSGDTAQELALRARHPLPPRPADRTHMVMLGGQMAPYEWTINGQLWGSHTPIAARAGERVEMTFHNMSMMAHPMHLHGHVFQVVAVNGTRISGALRDTVHVPPMGSVTLAFDAGEAAPWMLHCHHMAHMATGMMTELDVASA
ncbi:multicopper oxidase domain-containing protein [Rhodobacteraceae bacterium 2CG4]|uniref:Multicopper oxidase domain-containing protein n=1 Tax=Halovulum marinum TaxID=2662447 RepID=A0A6L5Z1B5_9RHOB|nr:multicopper oxidase domain-containing protein [Halovulum marinum]MSU90337.1 multicopper oxidase domain-containing protein [Halovulum marinum]